MTARNSFSDLLRQYRLEAGLTQEALAERAFVSAKSIGSLERDRSRLPRLETVRVLAEALALDEQRRERFLSAARPNEAAADGPLVRALALPNPSTPLYGRDQAVQLVFDLLVQAFGSAGSRMIVLTGAGGVGKTRLGLAAANRCAAELGIGSVFVDLTAVRDANMVVDAIARPLGVAGQDQIPIRDRVISRLGQRPTLLLLDNAEHLFDAGTDWVAMLDECPSLVMLITSRFAIGVRPERRVRVEPLDVPPPGSSAAEQVQAPAVALFIERARAAGWSADATQDLAAIAEICRRLDGLPLAIELAAAWMSMFTPGDLLRRLEQRLPLLTRGRNDMPARHRTMRNTVAWSYDLLDPKMQPHFRRVCIFANGAPISAVRTLVAGGVDPLAIEQELAELSDRSLIGWRSPGADSDDESELRILETIREFGLDLLNETGELVQVAERHAELMLESAERLAGDLGGPHETFALRRLDRAYDNLRVALTRCIDVGDWERSIRFVAALWRYWLLRGDMSEGAAAIEDVIALGEGSAGEGGQTWVSVLTGAALLAIERGSLQEAAGHVERALSAAQSTPGTGGLAGTHYAAGLLASQRGDNERAELLFLAGSKHADAEADGWMLTAILAGLARVVFDSGNPQRAVSIELERMERCRALGDRRGVAQSAKNLAFHAMYSGRFDEAARLGIEAAAELRALSDTGILAEVLWALGHMAYLKGEMDIAAEQMNASRDMRLARGDEPNAAKSSGALALIEISRGNVDLARSLVIEADRPLRAQGDRFGLAMNSIVRGHLEIEFGDLDAAASCLQEGGELLLEMNNLHFLAWYLEGMAILAANEQRWVPAAELLGARNSLSVQIEAPLPPVRAAGLEAARAATAQALGEAAFDQALTEGGRDAVDRTRAQILSSGDSLEDAPGDR